ncbi:MAG: hypothetical protein K9M54_08225 [Kiritimatiellales bacterium]|nr:hypothetical protein [Kiritimatiellales bacterium]
MSKQSMTVGFGIGMAMVLFGAVVAEATVIFHDGFEYGGTAGLESNLNTNYAARQAAGTTTSTYTGSAGSYLRYEPTYFGGNTLLLRATEGTTNVATQATATLATDFGASLVGTVWSLSYKGFYAQNTANKGAWSGFSVGNPPGTPNAGSAGFGINISGNGATEIWSKGVKIGTANVGNINAVLYTLTSVFDEGAGTVSLNFASATTNINMGTYNMSFVDSVRRVELKNLVVGDGGGGFTDMYFDDLTIQPIEPSLGLIDVNLLAGTNGLALTWPTANGIHYAVQAKTNLVAAASWQNAITNIPGTGGDVTVTTAVAQAQSFYRVIVE